MNKQSVHSLQPFQKKRLKENLSKLGIDGNLTNLIKNVQPTLYVMVKY